MSTEYRGIRHTTIGVMLVGDYLLVRQGIAQLLQSHADVVLVGMAAYGDEIGQLFKETRPDIVLLDLVIPQITCANIIPMLREVEPEVRIIALTNFDDKALMRYAIAQGVRGYFLKHISSEVLVDGIRRVYAGELVFGPIAMRTMLTTVTNPPHPAQYDLSRRELEVLALMVDGLTNAEIAHRLKIKSSTVKTYVGRIFAKLGVNNRVEATTVALTHQLVEV